MKKAIKFEEAFVKKVVCDFFAWMFMCHRLGRNYWVPRILNTKGETIFFEKNFFPKKCLFKTNFFPQKVFLQKKKCFSKKLLQFFE